MIGNLDVLGLGAELGFGVVGEEVGCRVAVLVGMDLRAEGVGQILPFTTDVATAVVIQRIFFCSSILAASGTACALE